MMAENYILCGQKGGTGKTTTAVTIACELKHSRGASVLVVDADPQRSASTWLAIGARDGQPVPTCVAMGAEMHRQGQLASLAAGYDAVVVDCPSRIDDRVGAVMRSALLYAGQHGGLAILPCGPSAMDVWALADSIEAVDTARVVVPELRAAVVVTRRSPSRTVIGESARAVLSEAGMPVLSSELRYRIAYAECPASGVGVTAYSPDSAAAGEVRALVDELTTGRVGVRTEGAST